MVLFCGLGVFSDEEGGENLTEVRGRDLQMDQDRSY